MADSSKSDSTKLIDSTPIEDTEWGRAEDPSLLKNLDDACSDGGNSVFECESDVEVAIIGGGLAGLAVAIGLYRSNIPFKVYERAPSLRSISQGILAVQPNGMKALETIHPDLPDMVSQAGCERQQLVFMTISKDGQIVEETVREIGQEAVEKFGCIKVGITWHRMQQCLAKLIPRESIVTSRSLVSFTERENEVILHFDDNHSAEGTIRKHVRAKSVIACDGLFSVARRQIHNDPPIYFGQLNWGTVIETEKLPPNAHRPNAIHYFMYEGEPRWMSMLSDGGESTSFWQFRVAEPEKALSLSGNRGRGGLGLKGVKESLLPVAKPSQIISNVIECIPENQIFERSIVGRLPVSTWLSHHGRLALLGDAAHGMHPNIAQGANSSFESAATAVQAMREEFEKCGGNLDQVDWRKAFQHYQGRRMPKASVVQRFSNIMGCFQATGQSATPKEDIPAINNWILGEDPQNYPSQETLDIIFAFDPRSQPGVAEIK